MTEYNFTLQVLSILPSFNGEFTARDVFLKLLPGMPPGNAKDVPYVNKLLGEAAAQGILKRVSPGVYRRT